MPGLSSCCILETHASGSEMAQVFVTYCQSKAEKKKNKKTKSKK
jgi:hypothetical protein